MDRRQLTRYENNLHGIMQTGQHYYSNNIIQSIATDFTETAHASENEGGHQDS